MELTLQGKSLVFAKNALFKAKYNAQFLSNEICSLKQPLLRRLYLNCRIVKFEDFEKKKRFFHSLTFSRYKQFGTKLSPIFGFAKSFQVQNHFSIKPNAQIRCSGCYQQANLHEVCIRKNVPIISLSININMV